MERMTACFTGHRRVPSHHCRALEAGIERWIQKLMKQGIVYYMAGGALGFDTLAAQTVLRMKKTFPQLRLILVLPCGDQTRTWAEQDVQTYEAIRRKADRVIVLNTHYKPGCMQARNRYLVDHSGICLAYCTRDAGGTAYTVRYAQSCRVPVIALHEQLEP